MRKLKLYPGTALLACVIAVGGMPAAAAPTTHDGAPMTVGNGTANTYVTIDDDGTPLAIGIRLTEAALDGLKAEPNNTTRCFDRNGDGQFEAGVECLGEDEFIMPFPKEAGLAKLPFQWMELDWNAHGHGPPNVYDKPHFDTHFYMVERDYVESIRPGTCGIIIDCEDFERASMPVPGNFLPAGYVDMGAAVARMGNHLLNPAAAELADPPQPFTHTFIYGAYDGRIMFMEPMMTREFLLTKPDLCTPFGQPAEWEVPGYYPSEYCMRYHPDESVYTISLEGFTGQNLTRVSADQTEYLANATPASTR